MAIHIAVRALIFELRPESLETEGLVAALMTNGELISLEIEDNGRGFDGQASFPDHLGLHWMEERVEGVGGMFQVISGPGQGTCVRVEVLR